ncbi:MAG: hypothetical protein K6E19_04265, partial [Lachnospiraceae bacterium]|nr:hypothetical protein [Lachnospiraceae bacterium]
ATRNKCVRKEQMKRADLRAKFQEAGLEAEKIDEIVNYIMDINGKDVTLAKNTAPIAQPARAIPLASN